MIDTLIDRLCRALCAIFWWRFRVIPKAKDPGVPLLRQLLVWKSAGLEVYIQHFDNPEDPEWFHCHEWPRMRSVVLSDMYVEERADRHGRFHVPHPRGTTYTMVAGELGWNGGSVAHTPATVWHRTHYWGAKCWTLFVCSGGRVVPRGYKRWDNPPGGSPGLGRFVPWRDHLTKIVPSLTGIRTP